MPINLPVPYQIQIYTINARSLDGFFLSTNYNFCIAVCIYIPSVDLHTFEVKKSRWFADRLWPMQYIKFVPPGFHCAEKTLKLPKHQD